jgi:hypothetical protein
MLLQVFAVIALPFGTLPDFVCMGVPTSFGLFIDALTTVTYCNAGRFPCNLESFKPWFEINKKGD